MTAHLTTFSLLRILFLFQSVILASREILLHQPLCSHAAAEHFVLKHVSSAID